MMSFANRDCRRREASLTITALSENGVMLADEKLVTIDN